MSMAENVETTKITDLVMSKDVDKDTIMALIGQKDVSTTTTSEKKFLPRLAIEHNTEDDDGKSLPKGQWRVENASGKTIHMKEIVFRPFIRTYMYSVWDQGQQGYSSMTIQAKSFGDKFFDTTGTLKCGKLDRKELDELPANAPERTIQATIKCSQVIYGTVDVKGVAVPHVWYARGSNFMPVSDWLKGLSKQGKIMFYSRATLTTEKAKAGGNHYYKSNIEEKDSVEPTDDDMVLLTSFQGLIDQHNEEVENKYREAKQDFEDMKLVNELNE